MEECFKALIDRLDWKNQEEDRCPFDLTKPLPLKGRLGHLIVAAEYFFNNDLEFMKSSDLEKKYSTYITKTKLARYEIVGFEDMTHTLWSTIKHGNNVYSTQKILDMKSVSVKKLHGYGHLEKIMVKRADQQLYKFKDGNFVDLYLNKNKDMLLLADQQMLLHLDGSVIINFIVALRVIYEDLNKQKQVIQTDKLYKFSNRTLKTGDEIYHRILNFCLGYNKEMSRRKWMATNKRRLEHMVELIDKQMQERRIIRNLEQLVGAQELEIDYKLMTRTV
nr:hypothetical protein [Tanacetum cinerariifolium]